MPDVIGHGKNGRGKAYYYSKEHILQLASVYVRHVERHTSDTVSFKNCDQTATISATEEQPEQPVAILVTDKQSRIEMALRFLNLLFGTVVERVFGYLWTKQDKATYPFAVSYLLTSA